MVSWGGHRSSNLSRAVKPGWGEIRRAGRYFRQGAGGRVNVDAASGRTFRAAPGSLQFIS